MNRKLFALAAVALASLPLATASHAHKITFAGELWCPDMNGDMVVDFQDVAELLAVLGTDCERSAQGEEALEADPPCPGDFNHSRYVGNVDLLIMVARLGPCPVKGDANGDGTVDIADLLKVGGDAAEMLDCHGDLDGNGRVSGTDLEIAEEVWRPGLDHHPRAHQIDGDDTSLSPLDLLLVFNALGRDCLSDANRDGHVGSEDVQMVCELAGLCVPADP